MKLDLATLELERGAHNDRASGVCLMEAVAWWANEPHSDQPKCASLIISAFGRKLNDYLPHDLRQQLVGYVPKLVGTAASNEIEQKRAYMLADWTARVVVPFSMEVIGAHCWADALRALPEVLDAQTAGEAESWLNFTRVVAIDATAAYAANAAYAYAAAYAVDAVADAADNAAVDAIADNAANAAAYATNAAANAAVYAVDAADAAAYAANVAASFAADAAACVAAANVAQEAWGELLLSALVLLDRMIALGGGK